MSRSNTDLRNTANRDEVDAFSQQVAAAPKPKPTAERGLKTIARLSGGAWFPFDASSRRTLKQLLGARAVYAAGGRKALADVGKHRGGAVRQRPRQITKD